MDDIRIAIPPDSPRFLDKLRLHIRQSGLAYRTEQTYVHWIKRFIYFHNKRHPKDMGAILKQLRGVHRLQIELMYGTGMRKAELLSLRYTPTRSRL